jgi:AcrR family transcriptional regulator
MSPSEPSLRERQSESVRQAIRTAFIGLLVERGPNGFPLTEVASGAGVSERTLYRYYPNRESLIEGVIGEDILRFDEEIGRRVGDRSDLGNPELVAENFAVFEERADLISAARMLRTAGLDRAASASRTGAVRAELEPHVPAEALDQMVALVRTLMSSDAWMRMSEPDIALDSRSAGHAVQWSIQVLLREAADVDGPLRPTSDWHP